MIKRTLVAFALLASSASAQTDPAAQPPASAETTPAVEAAPAAADASALAAIPEAAAPTPVVVPTDPMELVAFALANAREAQQCRFAFTRLQTTAAQVTWSNADAEGEIRFDPRLPIGERWTVVRASRQQRAIQRALSRQDRKGLPFDLITLAAEGEWRFENVALASELPDRYVYNFTPRMIPERSADETGAGIIEQLVGQLEVSRETGRVLASTLREPPPGTAVRAMGIVRVHRALLHNFYNTDAGGRQITESGSQMFQMSALLSQTEVTTSFRFTNVEPVCDPAEIERITAAEAAAQAADRR
jgi:hypothetical protein